MVQPFSTRGKVVLTFARAEVSQPRIASNPQLVVLTTNQISVQCVQPFQNYGKGAHMRARSYIPPLTSIKHIANGSLPSTKFQHSPSSHSSDMKKGGTSVCAHVQMYRTHGLCNMHRCLAYKHTSNLVTSGRAIPKLKLSDQIWHTSWGTHYLPG